MDNDELNRQLNKLGDAIAQYRKLKKITQEKLAEHAGLSLDMIGGYERKAYKNPSFASVIKVLGAVGVRLKHVPAENVSLQHIDTE